MKREAVRKFLDIPKPPPDSNSALLNVSNPFTALSEVIHTYIHIHTYMHTYLMKGSNVTMCLFVVQASYLRNTCIHAYSIYIMYNFYAVI